MQVKPNLVPFTDPEIHISRDDDVSRQDQIAVLSPHFKNLQREDQLSLYFAPNVLGDARVRLLSWHGKPAAHGSLFPFPFWIDGNKMVGGRCETAALHRDVMYKFPRPDLYGMVLDELLSEARESGWPLLITAPGELGRAALSKRGFQNVSMPLVDLFWPLSAAGFLGRAMEYVGRRYPKWADRVPRPVLRSAVHCALKALTAVARIKTAAGRSEYELSELPLEDLTRYAHLVEPNYWAGQRVTVWREPSYWQARLQVKPGYKLLGVWSRRAHSMVGMAIVHTDDGGLSLLDVLPPRVSLEEEFWRELIRVAWRAGAKALKTHLYLNNAIHAAVARQVYLRMATHSGRTNQIFSVLALDPTWAFAYDPNAWAGTDMLIVGF